MICFICTVARNADLHALAVQENSMRSVKHGYNDCSCHYNPISCPRPTRTIHMSTDRPLRVYTDAPSRHTPSLQFHWIAVCRHATPMVQHAPRGAHAIEVKLQFGDGTISYVADHQFTATPKGVCWHTTLDRDLNMVVAALGRFHGTPTHSICVSRGNTPNPMW